MDTEVSSDKTVAGKFLEFHGERYYRIANADEMEPFFISVVSSSDHWLFVSSNGGLTAGRVSPEFALFPYVPVDQVQDSYLHTGPKTLIRVDGNESLWEPFNREQGQGHNLTRHLYKNTLGNKICFEEAHHDANLVFRYTWMTSEEYGFVRYCELMNTGSQAVNVELVDGLQNILPAQISLHLQTNASNLVDAYKWSELEPASGLGIYSLASGLTDKPEPLETLKANTVFSLGLEKRHTLISASQLRNFKRGLPLVDESHKRGIRGSYFLNSALELAGGASADWSIVADVEKNQRQVGALVEALEKPEVVSKDLQRSVAQGSDALARIIGSADGFQTAAEENITVHHYANVLFNVLRGGAFFDQYQVSTKDFSSSIRHFNRCVFERHEAFLNVLPSRIGYGDLLSDIRASQDPGLERLCFEYLPITFGRRHGDPSRPWNLFAIRLKDEEGNQLLSYQGNWRDVFQNWEALCLSYPTFLESVIAKFVNASTVDGFNPYRITKEGIDWEVEDPDDPWSYIGYWGDHQIIYLLRLLELSKKFHPDLLGTLLHKPIFSYANVPYQIAPYESLINNPKATVSYDHELAGLIEERVKAIGADGKLVQDQHGDVYQVHLLEKLIVPLLSKLSNFVIGGGIWLNTQRPEWNDANNALVGNGLSMVTLYYLRRYVVFVQSLIERGESVELSAEVALWLSETAEAMAGVRSEIEAGAMSDLERLSALNRLGSAADRYRSRVYKHRTFSGKLTTDGQDLASLLEDSKAVIDHSIGSNKRPDGLYHAYNLADFAPDHLGVRRLYPMLEGQVAALSSGAVSADEAIQILQSLLKSDLYRDDQKTLMLYPDRSLPGFLEKNRVSAEQIDVIPLAKTMIESGNESILLKDTKTLYRFNPEIVNKSVLEERLETLASTDAAPLVESSREALLRLYEQVFKHSDFTGRSGGMFGFEGLGCIYWHMVSKLLVAAQEQFFAALDNGCDQATCRQLARLYYRVREGIGFNKGPDEYGAFPTDPYSHTPKHAGASQPGMTGQVKEEILTRFGELGVRVHDGKVRFQPALLRPREFAAEPSSLRYLDVHGDWQTLTLPASSLAFTWCQVPIVYTLVGEGEQSLLVHWQGGAADTFDQPALPAEASAEIFKRTGQIVQLIIKVSAGDILGE